MTNFRKLTINVVLMISAFMAPQQIWALDYESQETENYLAETRPNQKVDHDPDRFFRRLMVEASYLGSSYDGANSSYYTNASGYSVGALVDLIGRNHFALEVGILAMQLSTSINYGATNNASLGANYLVVPVSAKYYFSGQEYDSFFVKLGASSTSLTSNNNVVANGNNRITATQWELAALAGVGGKLVLSPTWSLIAEGDYSRPLSSAVSDGSVYRSDFTIGLGLSAEL